MCFHCSLFSQALRSLLGILVLWGRLEQISCVLRFSELQQRRLNSPCYATVLPEDKGKTALVRAILQPMPKNIGRLLRVQAASSLSFGRCPLRLTDECQSTDTVIEPDFADRIA